MRADLAVLILHMAGNVVWVGALLAVVVLLGGGGGEAWGKAALRVYRLLAVPGFLVSFGFGVARLLIDWKYYMVTTHFMHAKLLLVIVAIGLHHVVGAGAKKASGGAQVGGGRLAAGVGFGLACLGAIFLAVAKPF